MPETGRPALLLTCEHGGRRIPPPYRHLFRGAEARLDGHQGSDIGALACAQALGRRLGAPLFHSEVSRLLVDLNRSPGHPALFSRETRSLPASGREAILARHYRPHRARVERWIGQRTGAGRAVLHVAVHSFTPVLDGKRRSADIGLLYDPGRPAEVRVCRAWQTALADGGLRVRRNYPYRGTSDGFTRHLRTLFSDAAYAGIELEINQALLAREPAAALAATIAEALLATGLANPSRNPCGPCR